MRRATRLAFVLLAGFVFAALATGRALANGYDTYPAPLAISPDGQHIAALISPAWPYDNGLLEGSIVLYDGEGGNPQLVLSDGACGSPCFSPDARTLALIASGAVLRLDLAEFAAWQARPKPERQIYADSEEHYEGDWNPWEPAVWVPVAWYPALDVCWAPAIYEDSGYSLLVSGGERFYGCDIFHIDPWLNTARKLTQAGPANSALMPLMSADGRRMWFLRQFGVEAPVSAGVYERLCALQLNPAAAGPAAAYQVTQPLQLPDDYHESHPVLCGPDSLLFQRGGWGSFSLYRLDLHTNVETLEVADAQQPGVSADGRWLTFARRPAEAKGTQPYDWNVIPQVWLRDRQSGQEWQLSSALGGAEFPVITPDGSRVAWLQFENGEVVVRSILRGSLNTEKN